MNFFFQDSITFVSFILFFQCIPVVYILMTGRTKSAYVTAFDVVKDDLRTDEDVIRHFMTDYEIALQEAIREVWPDSRRSGCLFHFTQVS